MDKQTLHIEIFNPKMKVHILDNIIINNSSAQISKYNDPRKKGGDSHPEHNKWFFQNYKTTKLLNCVEMLDI